MTPEKHPLDRIIAVLGHPVPTTLAELADALERLAANADARERVHRRTLDQLRAAEREIDALRRDGGGR